MHSPRFFSREAMATESESQHGPQVTGGHDASCMRERIRAFDWSNTALGPMEHWPQPLKTAVQIALDSAFATYVWWGPQLIQIYNDAVAVVLGDMHPSALGLPARECWAALWPRVGPILEPVLVTGKSAAGTIEATLDRGGVPEASWFDFCYAALRDETGAVAGLFITAIETTERARAETALRESEERHRSLFDQMIAGVAESTLDGRIITANDCYCAMLGYSREEILCLKMQDITHPDDLPGNMDQFRLCREEGVPFEIEKRYIRKDGSIVWVHNSVSLVRDARGKPKSMVAAVLDITHRVRTEQALAEANRAKDEFLAMLGHELRNPLSPIVTTLQLMKMRAPDTFSAERSVIEQQVRYISDMVDDLLDVARIARGKVELRTAPVQIADIAAAAIETTQPLFEEREQMLHSAILDGLVVSGDRRRLVQVVVNLLANAAKYSPRGRAIYFSAAAEGNEVVLRVRDEGVGIDPALLPRVFELFTQDEQSIERSRGGLGLGLAIVRNLIEMHGGNVSASSAGRDRGSEFVVRLPLLERHVDPVVEKAPAVPAHGNGVRVNPRRAPARVLIVDDYVLAAESLGTLLQELGFETQIAHDGASALAAVAQFHPSIALVDIGLPVMDGYEVARRLRRTPGFERLPLVALTGYGQQSDRERVKQAGFDEHLVKPVDAERIGALIERLVVVD